MDSKICRLSSISHLKTFRLPRVYSHRYKHPIGQPFLFWSSPETSWLDLSTNTVVCMGKMLMMSSNLMKLGVTSLRSSLPTICILPRPEFNRHGQAELCLLPRGTKLLRRFFRNPPMTCFFHSKWVLLLHRRPPWDALVSPPKKGNNSTFPRETDRDRHRAPSILVLISAELLFSSRSEGTLFLSRPSPPQTSPRRASCASPYSIRVGRLYPLLHPSGRWRWNREKGRALFAYKPPSEAPLSRPLVTRLYLLHSFSPSPQEKTHFTS